MTHSLKHFDPTRVATLETKMWQAYYGHRFLQLGMLLVVLLRTQFGLNMAQSMVAAYYAGKAAADFRRDTKDYAKPLQNLRNFYQYINRHVTEHEKFDADKAAELELEWWLVHRYPKRYAPGMLAAALADATAVLHKVPAKTLVEHASARAEAMGLRDTATHHEHAEPDWIKIEALLQASYASLHRAVQ